MYKSDSERERQIWIDCEKKTNVLSNIGKKG